jgi:hypothetical protein
MKDYVYRTSLDGIGTLRARIIEVIRSVLKGMKTRRWAERDYRFDVIRANRISLVEVD